MRRIAAITLMGVLWAGVPAPAWSADAPWMSLEKEVAQFPNDALLKAKLAWAYADGGRRADAIKLALSVRQAGQKEAAVLASTLLGHLADKPESSLAHFAHALALDPQSPIPLLYRAAFYLKQGKLAEAQADYEKGYGNAPAGLKEKTLADLHVAMANGLATLPILEKLAQTHPNDIKISMLLAAIYRETGNGELAIAEYRRQLALGGDKPNLFMAIGNSYLELEQYAFARDSYKRVVDLAPEHQAARLALASLLVGEGDLKQARGELKKLTGAEAIRGRWLLGLIELLEGRKDEAKKAWQGLPPSALGALGKVLVDKERKTPPDGWRELVTQL